MNSETYKFIETYEEIHWWFRGRRDIIKMFLTQQRDYFDMVLDIGCGTGNFLKNIKELSNKRYGIDEHNYRNADSIVLQGDALAIPFDDNSMDLVTMLDVLEHIAKSDKAIDEMWRVIKKDGIGVITVPAMQFLYSPHDANYHHIKRYGKKDLCAQLTRNRFQVLRCSYFNTWLFPVEVMVRLIEKIFKKELPLSSTSQGKIINKILYKIFNSETKILEKHNLPYGLSLIAVVKPVK